MDIICFIIILSATFLKNAFVKERENRERMCFALFAREVAMEKLNLSAGFTDGEVTRAHLKVFCFQTHGQVPLASETFSNKHVFFRILMPGGRNRLRDKLYVI